MTKGIEWLKEEIERIDTRTRENFPHYEGISKAAVLYAIDQLDELDKYVKMALDRGQQLLKVQSERDKAEQELMDLKERKPETTREKAYSKIAEEFPYNVPEIKLILSRCNQSGVSVAKLLDRISNHNEPEKVVVPQFVADWIEETKRYNSLRVAFEYIAQRKKDSHDDEQLAFWVKEGNSETFARAWLDGYEVEERELTVKGVIEEHIELLKKQEVAVNLKPYYDLWEELKDE